MSQQLSRRRFLQQAGALSAATALTGPLIADEKKAAPGERLNLGIIGVAGRGGENLQGVTGENIVALCDVDINRAEKVRKTYPRAQFYQDFRRLLDQKDIDAVVISTPDHTHAVCAVGAMRAGKHVYCEKPLAHTVREVRLMRETAAKHKLVTQMGTQIHAGDNYRRVVEIVRSGALGPVRRVHVWCERKPDLRQAAKTPVPVPEGLDYDLWLGPAPQRSYDPAHHHFHWRWFWDYGGGVLADMACHFMDLPFWALDLRGPTTIAATGKRTYEGASEVPDLMQVEYEFPARSSQPAVHLTWYHGVTGPDLAGKVSYAKMGYGSGVLFEGEKGQLLANYGQLKLLPEEKFKDVVLPPKSIPASVGHHKEWIEAVKRGGPTTCNFDYSGALTEAVLLGNVSFRCGQKLTWDDKACKVTNTSEAEEYMQREYRKGWKL